MLFLFPASFSQWKSGCAGSGKSGRREKAFPEKRRFPRNFRDMKGIREKESGRTMQIRLKGKARRRCVLCPHTEMMMKGKKKKEQREKREREGKKMPDSPAVFFFCRNADGPKEERRKPPGKNLLRNSRNAGCRFFPAFILLPFAAFLLHHLLCSSSGKDALADTNCNRREFR